MERVQASKCFSFFVPFASWENSNSDQIDLAAEPCFGFFLVDSHYGRLFISIKVVCKQRLTSKEYEQKGCLCWATRSPLIFTKQTDEPQHAGLILRLKVKQGAFDFRKVEKRFIRLQIECRNKDGHLINTATSQFFQLLPRKRRSNVFDGDHKEGISCQWLCNKYPLYGDRSVGHIDVNTLAEKELTNAFRLLNEIRNETELTDSSTMIIQDENNLVEQTQASQGIDENQQDSNNQYVVTYFTEEHNGFNVFNSSKSEIRSIEGEHEQQHLLIASNNEGIVQHQHTDEQYMVLYNGDAEVVGNFRALNFYKASDLNIKEDVRLLIEDHDRNPRDVLLKIDGVSYKFKPGTTHATHRRFVGYIAQQIESVVPEAVQLIDGILHVDYESLIPYLTESIKQNFDDIYGIELEQQRIKMIVDMLYEDFLKREPAERNEKPYKIPKATNPLQDLLSKQSTNPWPKVIIMVLGGVLMITTMIAGLYLIGLTQSDSWTPTEPAPRPTPLAPLNNLEKDRLALIHLFVAANGGNWIVGPSEGNYNRNRWLSDTPMCTWAGVTCTRNRVTLLQLTNFNLHGTIPESIGNLDALAGLVLDQNNLTGTIPASISRLHNLVNLRMSSNPYLSGSIPALPTSLEMINITGCNLTGTIPESMSILPKLENLILSDNQLSGTIPPFQKSLQRLILNNNQLEGTLPKFESRLFSRFGVPNNRLNGTLFNLKVTSFFQLFIQNNNFSGDVMPFNTTNLVVYRFDNNQFTSFNSSLTMPPSLTVCSGKNNPLQYPIPLWVGQKCNVNCHP